MDVVKGSDWTDYQVRKHRKQRADRGFSDYDVWSLDDYLLQVIADSIEALRDTRRGFPGAFSKEYGDGTEDEGWTVILNKIIEGIRLDLDTTTYSFKRSDEDEKKIKEAWDLFIEWRHALWD